MEKIKINIVITMYKTLNYTLDAIESLIKNTKNTNKIDFKFYIIDNNTFEFNKDLVNKIENKTGVICIKNKKNMGLTYSWNKAYQLALEDDCKYLVISNNDVLFSPHWAERLVNEMEKNYSFGAAGPISNAPGHIDHQNVRMYIKNYIPDKSDNGLKDVSKAIINLRSIKLNRLNGFCMMFRMSVLNKSRIEAGCPFNPDPKYTLYGAEDEFFDRTQAKCMVVPSSFVFHYKQVTVEKLAIDRPNFKHQLVR